MRFEDCYQRDNDPVTSEAVHVPTFDRMPSGFEPFMRRNGGCSFERGLYRIHAIADFERWTRLCVQAFPAFKDRVHCFASDWLGRQFALDFAREEGGECLVLMMEPGTGQALEIPAGFQAFHESELVAYREDALAAEFFQQWLRRGGLAPSRDQCIGYKVPLFLGGADDIQNLELVAMEIYWSLCGQLLDQTRDLPSGTRIGKVEII